MKVRHAGRRERQEERRRGGEGENGGYWFRGEKRCREGRSRRMRQQEERKYEGHLHEERMSK